MAELSTMGDWAPWERAFKMAELPHGFYLVRDAADHEPIGLVESTDHLTRSGTTIAVWVETRAEAYHSHEEGDRWEVLRIHIPGSRHA